MTGQLWCNAMALSSTRVTTDSFPIWFSVSCVVPAGSKPALPAWNVKPWRSPAPCAATKSAAGKTRRNRGARGSISNGRLYCRPQLKNTSKYMEKENTRCPTPQFRRHRSRSAKSIKQSVLLSQVQPGARCDTDGWVEESGELNNSWKRTKSSNALKKVSSKHKRAVRKNTPKESNGIPKKTER